MDCRLVYYPTVDNNYSGSRTSTGTSGFAGVIRNVYLCGEEIHLNTLARRESERGIVPGEDGYCRHGLCKNGGACIDKYDTYLCDCSLTPFGGDDCTKGWFRTRYCWMVVGNGCEIYKRALT